MSVDPGGLESGSDPQDPVLDFDEESTLEDNEVLDPIDENDNDNDPEFSVYDTSWVPEDRPSRRTDYGDAELDAWAARIRDTSTWKRVYVYFKHEESGRGPALARALLDRLGTTSGAATE